MNIKINSEESFKKEMISAINNLSERMDFIEDVILAENDDLDENQENNSEDDINDCDYCKLDNEFTKNLIVSMNRLKEYDKQRLEEYYKYLEDDDYILYELESLYDED